MLVFEFSQAGVPHWPVMSRQSVRTSSLVDSHITPNSQCSASGSVATHSCLCECMWKCFFKEYNSYVLRVSIAYFLSSTPAREKASYFCLCDTLLTSHQPTESKNFMLFQFLEFLLNSSIPPSTSLEESGFRCL